MNNEIKLFQIGEITAKINLYYTFESRAEAIEKRNAIWADEFLDDDKEFDKHTIKRIAKVRNIILLKDHYEQEAIVIDYEHLKKLNRFISKTIKTMSCDITLNEYFTWVGWDCE